MSRIVWIGGFSRSEHGKLRAHRLTQHYRSSPPDQGYAGGVPCGLMPCIDRRAVGGGHVKGVNDVLNPNRYAVQGSQDRIAVARAGFFKGLLRIEESPSPNGLFPFPDPGQTCRHKFLAGELSPGNGAGRFSSSEFVQWFHRSLLIISPNCQ